MAKTIKKARGEFDWEYGLMERLPDMAISSPNETLEIVRYYILDPAEDKLNVHRKEWMYIDRNLKATLRILYSNAEIQIKVYDLINKLVEVGGRQFWSLKDVLKTLTSTLIAH